MSSDRLARHLTDLIIQKFRRKLETHLLRRARGHLAAVAVEGAPPDSIRIKDECIFEHSEIHFNYTTYDLHRKYDVIRTSEPDRANIMTLADPDGSNSEDAIPASHFHYARVLKAYHAHVYLDGPNSPGPSPVRLDFHWVR